MNDSLFYLLSVFFKKNHIKFDKEEAQTQLLSHPYYPSINSITDLFNHFNIDNLALKVNNERETFSQIPQSFLAQINENNESQLVLVSKNKNKVELIYDKNTTKSLNVEEFLNLWTGILIVIEKPENKENIILNKSSTLKKIVSYSTLLGLLSLYFFTSPNIFQIIFFTLSCIGVYVSYLIITQELGVNSKILDKFCSGENKNTSCNVVLNSKGATVFGLFKLSDIGITYFTSLAIGNFISSTSNLETTSIYGLLSILAIPFTFYSIFYQWKIIKNWCPLCLTIIGIIWLQFSTILLSTTLWEDIYVINLSYVFYFASLLTSITLWILIKPFLIKEQLLKKIEIEHYKFKRNFKLFNATLKLESSYNTIIPSTSELVFGSKNTNSYLNIVLITNPMCGFCKETHQLVEKILKREDENIKVIIRFNVQKNEENIGTKIAAKLLELYHSIGEKKCLNALSDIYSEMDDTTWFKKWGTVSDLGYYRTLKIEQEWCNYNKINFTPALIINGKMFPSEYGKMDLLFFLDELIEQQKKAEKSHSDNFIEII